MSEKGYMKHERMRKEIREVIAELIDKMFGGVLEDKDPELYEAIDYATNDIMIITGHENEGI